MGIFDYGTPTNSHWGFRVGVKAIILLKLKTSKNLIL